jgi:hypothetical protein
VLARPRRSFPSVHTGQACGQLTLSPLLLDCARAGPWPKRGARSRCGRERRSETRARRSRARDAQRHRVTLTGRAALPRPAATRVRRRCRPFRLTHARDASTPRPRRTAPVRRAPRQARPHVLRAPGSAAEPARATPAQGRLGLVGHACEQLDGAEQTAAVVNRRGRQPELRVTLLRTADVAARYLERSAHCLEAGQPHRDIGLACTIGLVFGDWATQMGICSRAESRTVHPGDEGFFYSLNPGEGFAEAYRVLVEDRRHGDGL